MSQRSRDTPDTRIDERLARLLEVERRVEAQVRAAEDEARARVAAAREAVTRADADGHAALEAASAVEEREDRERHAEVIRRLEAEGEASLAAVVSPSGARLDELARRAFAIVVSGGATAVEVRSEARLGASCDARSDSRSEARPDTRPDTRLEARADVGRP